MKKRISFNKAFTLIELLVVISIIGMLSSVVLVSVSNARTKAKDASRIEAISQIRNALELYYSDQKSYPTTPTTIETLVSGALSPYIKSLNANFVVPSTVTKYASDGKNYELMIKTETGGSFAKNNGCYTADYNSYNNDSKAYCLGNNPAGALVISSPASISCSVSPNSTTIFTNTQLNFTANVSNFTPVLYSWSIKGVNYTSNVGSYSINLSYYPAGIWHNSVSATNGVVL